MIRTSSKAGSVMVVPLAVMLAACHGDGSNRILVGTFTDSPVAGLTYETESRSGLTNTAGQFLFFRGETIRFSVGGVSLGDPVPAKREMTPLDLVPDAKIYRTTAAVRGAIDHYSNEDSPLSTRQEPSFERLTNVLVFLQTFDSDTDPTRIEISAGVTNMLAQAHIDFNVGIYDFQEQDSLRFFAWRAARDGLIPTASPQKPGAALDHFYDALGIETAFRVPRTSATADGIEEYELDTSGYLVAQRIYSVAPEGTTLNRVHRWHYNEHGDLLIEGQDTNDDGEIDSPRSQLTYDEFGELTTSSVRGIWQQVSRDDQGNQTSRFSTDSLGSETTKRFGAHGQPLETRLTSGNLIRIATHSYDMRGTPTSRRDEVYQDGGLVGIWEWSYSPSGNNTELRIDGTMGLSSPPEPMDGITDLINYSDYDAQGRLVASRVYRAETGQTELVDAYEYDSEGRWTLIERAGSWIETRKFNADGALEQDSRHSLSDDWEYLRRFTYDVPSKSTRVLWESSGGAPPTSAPSASVSESYFAYDDIGALISIQTDLYLDGTIDEAAEIGNQTANWTSLLEFAVPKPIGRTHYTIDVPRLASFTTPDYYENAAGGSFGLVLGN